MTLSQIRTDHRDTQEELAKYLGLPISTYNLYEKGRRSIPRDIAVRISEKYSIPIDDIFLPSKFSIREHNDNNKESQSENTA